MRFAISRLTRSLAAQLLCTYVAALILTTSVIAAVFWFGSVQEAGVTTQGQLSKAVDLIHRSLRFDSAAVPRAVVSLPSDFHGCFTISRPI